MMSSEFETLVLSKPLPNKSAMGILDSPKTDTVAWKQGNMSGNFGVGEGRWKSLEDLGAHTNIRSWCYAQNQSPPALRKVQVCRILAHFSSVGFHFDRSVEKVRVSSGRGRSIATNFAWQPLHWWEHTWKTPSQGHWWLLLIITTSPQERTPITNEEKGRKQYYRMHSTNQCLQNFPNQNRPCLFKSGILWHWETPSSVWRKQYTWLRLWSIEAW